MPFVRRKRGLVLVVHNNRLPGGRTAQVVLHGFSCAAELRALLGGASRWSAWQAELQWRHPDYEWRWQELRDRLRAELDAWEDAETSGALHRRVEVVRRLADELASDLRVVSPARPADGVLVSLVRGPLEALFQELERLLGESRRLSAPEATPAQDLDELGHRPGDADRIFDEGMELWWAGDRRGACRLYRKALARDPGHADAHNHLGIERYDRGRLRDAERHFRAAVDGGLRAVVRDGDRVEWGHVENRPYLRALANLALALSRQGRWREAVEHWERLLHLNPDDGQGIRFLVGAGYLRLGRLDDAVRASERGGDDPGTRFDLALALHASGEPTRAGVALLQGFAGNRYVAPMLLGERWRRLDGFHGTSMAEPEWAKDYVERQGDLWRSTAGSADVLRRWWHAEPVRAWRARLDDVIVQLGKLPIGDQRTEVVALAMHLTAPTTCADVARAVDLRAEPDLPTTTHRKARPRGRERSSR